MPTTTSEKSATPLSTKSRLPRWLAMTLALTLALVALWLPKRISQIEDVEVRWDLCSLILPFATRHSMPAT